MITQIIKVENLDRGNIFKQDDGRTYRVIVNSDCDVLLEQLIPTHNFTWWDIRKEKGKDIEIIKSS